MGDVSPLDVFRRFLNNHNQNRNEGKCKRINQNSTNHPVLNHHMELRDAVQP